MKRTIRLTESDLHNMVRTAINEVLDNMDDTEKAYWLMQQRQQRPNTKSKTPVNYGQQFAQKFNGEVYGNPETFNNGGGYNHDTGTENGRVGVDRNGNFVGDHSQTLNTQPQNWSPNYNFRYTQNAGSNQGNTQVSPMRGYAPSKNVGLQDIGANDAYVNQFNKGYQRYNQIQQKYNQQRQSQQPQG